MKTDFKNFPFPASKNVHVLGVPPAAGTGFLSFLHSAWLKKPAIFTGTLKLKWNENQGFHFGVTTPTSSPSLHPAA